jgi:hypothetical protein
MTSGQNVKSPVLDSMVEIQFTVRLWSPPNMRTSMRSNRIPCVTLAAAIAAGMGAKCLAQEVGSVDLTEVTARTDLRRPPPTPGASGARGGNHEVHACFDSTNNAGTLRTTLASLDRTQYRVGDEPTFEVTVENVGSLPLKIPFSPHLADLQPADPGQKFTYSELAVVLWIGGTQWSANTGGGVALYGAEDHADTMLTLNPGESVRIIGKGKFVLPTDGVSAEVIHSGHAVDHVYAQVSVYRVETLLTPTAVATLSREVCLRQTQGESVPIALTGPKH